jgi:hypothetical protein
MFSITLGVLWVEIFYRMAKKVGICDFSTKCSPKRIFSKIILWGRFLWEKSIARIVKSWKRFPDPKSAKKTIKNCKNPVFGLIWGQGSVFKVFQCSQLISRIEKNPHMVILEKILKNFWWNFGQKIAKIHLFPPFKS